MEATRANLRLVGDTAADTFPWPETGELLSFTDAHSRIADLKDRVAGMHAEVERLARDKVRLERRVAEDESADSHPHGKEIVALIERWRTGSGHPQAKVSGDRIKYVKSRIKDGYPITSDDPFPTEPTLELAVDGICSHPYVTNAGRCRDGKPSNRHDRLGICLGGGEKVEEFARLGYAARREGWTPGSGWPA